MSSGTLFLRHLLSLIHLGLLSFQETAGGGLVFWHPQGARVRSIIEDYWRARHREAGYELLFTPHIAKLDLWKTSGHFDFYKENMFDQVGGGWEDGIVGVAVRVGGGVFVRGGGCLCVCVCVCV